MFWGEPNESLNLAGLRLSYQEVNLLNTFGSALRKKPLKINNFKRL
jgi:hypothetical protein